VPHLFRAAAKRVVKAKAKASPARNRAAARPAASDEAAPPRARPGRD
jgi:hypothetical protein